MTDIPKSAEQLVADAIGKAEEMEASAAKITEEVTKEAPAEAPKEEAKVEEKKEEVKAEEKKEDKKEDEKKDEKKEEEKKEEVKEDEKMAERVASRFAALTRKEKALRMKEKELSDRAAKYKDLEDLVAMAKDNPIEAIAKLGLDYEQLTAYLLKGDKPELKKFSKLEQEIEELKKAKQIAEQEATQTRVEAKVNEFKSNIKNVLSTGADSFELLNANPNAIEVVYDVISQDFDAKVAEAEANGLERPTNEDIMSIEDAAKIVEDYLFAEISKYSKLKKFAPKEAPKAPESKKEIKEEKKEQTSSSPSTLSNSMTNTAPQTTRPLTRDEEIDLVSKRFKLWE